MVVAHGRNAAGEWEFELSPLDRQYLAFLDKYKQHIEFLDA